MITTDGYKLRGGPVEALRQALRQALATEEALDRMVAENQRLGLYDEDNLQTAIEKGTKAWADVPNASEWVEELRGNDTPEETTEVTPEVPCKTHPDAPHGFNRNASFDEDRYVCDCEFWEPPEETLTLDRGCYERGCVAYDERDGDGVTISEKCVHKTDKSIHEWVGLTDEERFGEHTRHLTRNEWALLIEAKLKDKNT